MRSKREMGLFDSTLRCATARTSAAERRSLNDTNTSGKPLMTSLSSAFRQLTLATLTTLACVSGAMASPSASTQAQERYRQDIARCNSGQSNQSAVDCRREAGNALAEAKRGAIHNDPTQFQRNALQRCTVHEGDDRAACEARIIGQGDVTTEVEAGGILRKSITVKPAR